jgi:phage terminase Nu1 subunit (DNA packaging protein)
MGRHGASDGIIGKVSAAVCADVLGVSAVTFAKYINEGVIARQREYDLRVVCRAVLAHYRRIASGRAGEGGSDNVLASARARQAVATAEMVELRNAVAKSQYVPLAAVRIALEEHIVAAREVALSLPGKTAPNLVGRDGEEIYVILEAEIYEMLERLADGDTVADEAVEHQRNGKGVLKRDRRYRTGTAVADEDREGFVAHDDGHDLGGAFNDAGSVAGRNGRPPSSDRRDLPGVLRQRDGGATFP